MLVSYESKTVRDRKYERSPKIIGANIAEKVFSRLLVKMTMIAYVKAQSK
jgi:hypothetical protein